MIFDVVYPSGERAQAVGYPGSILVVQTVPPGPESCLYDELEVAHVTTPGAPLRVLRIVGGPRRVTHRVRIAGGVAAREAWMSAREAEGWATLDGMEADRDIVWVAALRDDLDVATLGDLAPRTP